MAVFDKGQTLQQCRFLAEHSTSEEARCDILVALLWIFNTEGTKVMSDADLKNLFISLTKVLTVSTMTVQILSMRCVHAILPRLTLRYLLSTLFASFMIRPSHCSPVSPSSL